MLVIEQWLRGPTGVNICRELRASPATMGLPILLLTVPVDDTEILDGFAAGADDYLIKPFSAPLLAARIVALVRMKRLRERAERAEQEARNERDRFQALIEQSGDGIVAADERGRILMCNQEARKQWGLASGEGIVDARTTGFELLTLDGHPLVGDDLPLNRAVRGEKIEAGRWRIHRRDGSVRVLTGTASPLRHADGSPAGALPVSTQATAPARAAAPATATPAQAQIPAAAAAAPEDDAPTSLRGTDEDGSLTADESGNLVVGPGILAFFDYHLSATGEIVPAALRARILARIRARLPERAAGQATTLLDRYLAYREATRQLRDDGDSAARLDALHRLRQRIFGDDDAAKLFGDQERTDAVALAEQRVHQDPSLSPEARSRRLAELEQGLPEAVRIARARATLPLREQEEEASRRAAGQSDEEIRGYRVATVGEAAADRLEVLDAQRDAWAQRLKAYRAARAAIAAKSSDPAAQRAAEAQLLEASFNAQERLRVAALDAMAAEPPADE